MARKNRTVVPDGTYHVTSRIAGRARLLADPKLKDEIVAWLHGIAAFAGVELLAWCIMDNHFHILVHVPAAILCYYDPPAVQVLNACHELGLHVPSQVAVLGVDNDTPICEAATPQLSSIQPDHENLGYLAARQLHAILSHRKNQGRKIRLTHRIIERETTKPIAPSANLVRRALAYIAENAAKGIDVQDVVESLGVSRRLADLRFREIEGTSIHDAIETQKLKIATQKLKGTEWPIGRIAAACGYSSLQAFEAAFRKRFGRSPRSFRHTEKNVPSDGWI